MYNMAIYSKSNFLGLPGPQSLWASNPSQGKIRQKLDKIKSKFKMTIKLRFQRYITLHYLKKYFLGPTGALTQFGPSLWPKNENLEKKVKI